MQRCRLALLLTLPPQEMPRALTTRMLRRGHGLIAASTRSLDNRELRIGDRMPWSCLSDPYRLSLGLQMVNLALNRISPYLH